MIKLWPFLAASMLATPALAQGPSLVLQPSVSSVNAGQSFTVNVIASGVQDLFAYQFNLVFPAALATVTSVMQGPFLGTGGTTFFIPGAPGGAQPLTAAALIGPIPGVNGGGTLATIGLTATAAGPVQLSLGNVILLNSTLATVNATITGATVTANQPGALLTPFPANLAFTYQLGQALPQAQTISLQGSALFGAAMPTVPWISVLAASVTLPGNLSVSVNPAGLAPGQYIGLLNLTGNSTPSGSVPVSLTVYDRSQLITLADSLSFIYTTGGPPPAAQPLYVTASSLPAPVSAGASTASGGNWLAVSPTSANTPANLAVSVQPANLAPGTYQGTLTLSSAGAANSPKNISVTLVVNASPPSIAASGIVNAASYASGSIAPGEVVTIFGSGLGPAVLVQANVSGTFGTALAGTRVLFDGLPAPVLYTQDAMVSVIVPYDVAGRATTQVQVEYQGKQSPPITMVIAATAPGLFTMNGAGKGQAAALNEDGTVNGPVNPVQRGHIVVLYGTGAGQTIPAGVDGTLASAPLGQVVQPVAVLIGGVAAEVVYAGAAPGLVSGTLQLNVRLSESVTPGSAVPVTVQLGEALSQAGVTINVQ